MWLSHQRSTIRGSKYQFLCLPNHWTWNNALTVEPSLFDRRKRAGSLFDAARPAKENVATGGCARSGLKAVGNCQIHEIMEGVDSVMPFCLFYRPACIGTMDDRIMKVRTAVHCSSFI